MRKYLLPETGNFYKTNLHVHSTLSDGKLTPAELKEVYKAHGYSVLAFSDHELLFSHPELADPDFLPLTSFEIAFNETTPGVITGARHVCHLNLFAPKADTPYSSAFCEESVFPATRPYITDIARAHAHDRVYSAECINEIIAVANAEGFLVSLNHPVWSLQCYEEYKDIHGLWGVECRNHECYVNGFTDTTAPLDDLLRLGQNVYPLATDDAHRRENCCGGWIQIKAPRLEYESVFAAMKKGDFYASTGPEIKELYIEDGILHIATSAASHIALSTDRRLSRGKHAAPGTPMFEADFDLTKYVEATKKQESSRWPYYVRLTVTDPCGNPAYTRAYSFRELCD